MLSLCHPSLPVLLGVAPSLLCTVPTHASGWVGAALVWRVEGTLKVIRCTAAVNKQATDYDLLLLFFLP